jgi:hypothetical protein
MAEETTKVETAHTQEPWRIGRPDQQFTVILNSDGYEVAEWCDQADARRIVAAVNACAGIPTEALERGLIAKFIDLLQRIGHVPPHAHEEFMQISEASYLARGLVNVAEGKETLGEATKRTGNS